MNHVYTVRAISITKDQRIQCRTTMEHLYDSKMIFGMVESNRL
jgi:hypothetical protein